MPRKSDKAGASAARAADALASAGGFGGLGGFGLSYESQIFKSEVLEVGDTELNFCFKKLSKKDAVTKCKALDELAALFADRAPDALIAVLPAWVQAYGRLAHDNDKKVREAVYRAFAPLLSPATKKAFATHLKSVLPNWLMHMYDPFREVSRAARELFEATFTSPAKRRDVLLYCRAEFLECGAFSVHV